jgi:putative endonuclease
MAGLDPATSGRTRGGWVYIMTNRPYGTLYIGVTSNLAKRVYEHRTGTASAFTHRYNLHRLVYAEHHDEILAAIQREKTMKHWSRAWKLDLIATQNPTWTDLPSS